MILKIIFICSDYVNLLNFFAENNIDYEVSIEDFLNFIINI